MVNIMLSIPYIGTMIWCYRDAVFFFSYSSYSRCSTTDDETAKHVKFHCRCMFESIIIWEMCVYVHELFNNLNRIQIDVYTFTFTPDAQSAIDNGVFVLGRNIDSKMEKGCQSKDDGRLPTQLQETKLLAWHNVKMKLETEIALD